LTSGARRELCACSVPLWSICD